MEARLHKHPSITAEESPSFVKVDRRQEIISKYFDALDLANSRRNAAYSEVIQRYEEEILKAYQVYEREIAELEKEIKNGS